MKVHRLGIDLQRALARCGNSKRCLRASISMAIVSGLEGRRAAAQRQLLHRPAGADQPAI
jgi:hypothetical protein